MTPEQFELFYILKKQDIPFEERFSAAKEIGDEALFRRIEEVDIPLFYPLTVDLWRSLGSSKTERDDKGLFEVRKKLANVCWRLSVRSPGGQKFFKYFPRVKRAIGFEDRVFNKLIKGALKTGYGSSLYEFHWEYPIEGSGIRKDHIYVITDDNEKIPMMDWCEQNEVIIYCNRCGLDITYEVSKDCPYMKGRYY
jgi:hypothetical protein